MVSNFPRLNIRQDEALTKEDFVKNKRRARKRELKEVKYVDGVRTIQEDVKLFIITRIDDETLFAQPDLEKGAELVAYFMEICFDNLTQICLLGSITKF